MIWLGQPEHSVITTCAYCGVGCGFKAEMKGNEVVRMVPWKDGKANDGHSCVKGRFAWGYATHKDRITKPMIREQDHRPVAGSELGRGDRLRRQRVQAHPGQVRPGLDRRHHLVALHQRRNLPGAEAGARRLRQQQRRHLRARLPLAHRLRPQADAAATSAGTQTFKSVEKADVIMVIGANPTDGASGVRLAHEEAAARGREADRRRPAPHRHGEVAAREGRVPPAAEARHQRRGDHRAGARGRDRRPGRRGVRRRALRHQALRRMAGVRRAAGELARSDRGRHRRAGGRRARPRRACMRHAPATAPSTTAWASPSTARARPW